MDCLNELNDNETKEYKEILKTVNSDPETQKLCLQYFLTFKRQMGYISPEKLTIAMKCAYFMAEKSQYVCTVGGQKIAGYSLSLNDFLQNHNLEDILITLREFNKRVKVSNSKSEQELNGVVEQLSFLIKMHSKFEETIKQLNLKERGKIDCVDYLRHFKSITWLLYISTKRQILKKSLQIVENTCLLAHAICSMLITAWDYCRPATIVSQSNLKDDTQWKDIAKTIRQKILQKFYIKNMDLYKHIAQAFEQEFKKMMTTAVLKGHIVNKGQNQIVDFLAPQIITNNYQRLDTVYRKSLNYNDLDQRIFDKDRDRNLTPNKITPFAKQGYINRLAKMQNQPQNANFASHRILNYDPIEHQDTSSQNKPQSYQKITIPKSIKQTPSTIKQPLIQTPISSGMEMFNYLFEKTKKMKGKAIDPSIDLLITQIFQKDIRNGDPYARKVKKQMIFSLYSITTTQYLMDHPQENNNDNVKKGFLAIATELVFFVSNINVSFETIEEVLQLEVLQEWKACDFFLNFDKTLPAVLKLHLLDLEVGIVSYKMWRESRLVQALQRCAEDEEYGNGDVLRLFKRLLLQTAYQIVTLAGNFKLQEDVNENIFETMKQIILNYTELLQGYHLDQLILCSAFVNCKIKSRTSDKYAISFTEIIDKYEDANPNNKKLHSKIIQKIDVGEGKHLTIIQFYNTVFIPSTRELFRSRNLNQKQNLQANHKRRNSVLRSPLKNIIPKQFSMRPKKTTLAQNKQQVTPQTSLLMAYNESPMLKCDYHSIKAPLNSKKVIDFDVEEQKLLNNIEYQEMEEEKGTQNQTTDFFAKRFKNKGNNNNAGSQTIHHMPITNKSSTPRTVLKGANSGKSFGGILNR